MSTTNAPTAWQPPVFDTNLIHKYNRQGPRYTSYPTALQLSIIDDPTLEADILRARDVTKPLSLYLHIPFCRHLCYYCGCNKIITKKNADAGDYLQYLFAEIDQKRALLSGDIVVKQVHLGGGTPTFLSDEELVQLWQFLQSRFVFSQDSDADFSVEIDPRELRDTTLSALKSCGVNRLSFGVQDLDERVQIAVNRVQSYELISRVMDEARQLGFGSINIDLIYGLPHQSISGLQETVRKIIALSPDRLSVFNYAHLPSRFTAQRKIDEDCLPSPSDKLVMLSNTISALDQAGYQYIGIDHFAKPDDSLAQAQRQGALHRNFQGYTTHKDCDLLGFGVSSISQIGNHILQNDTALSDYQARIRQGKLPAVKHLSADHEDRLRAHIIMQLLCHDQVDFNDVKQRFGVWLPEHFADSMPALNEMATDGLIWLDSGHIQILAKGRILARNVAMVFDSYLPTLTQDRFSKVI